MYLKFSTAAIILLLGRLVLQAQTLNSVMLPGEASVPEAPAEENHGNRFLIGVRSSATFDDNALSATQNKQANELTVVEPHIGVKLSNSRAKWALDYLPGFSTSYPISIYSPLSHSLDSSFHVRLTKRLTLQLHENLLQTNNMFDQLQASELAPSSSVLDQPANLLAAAARVTSEQASAGFTYVLGSRDAVELSTAFYNVGYDLSANHQQLSRAEAASMHLLYSRQLTRRSSAGLDFNVQNLVSWGPRSRSHVHSLLYTDSLLLTRNMAVTLFVGPEHSTTLGELTQFPLDVNKLSTARSGWNWAGGANYVWSGRTTKLSAGWSRRISDGVALQGVVRLSSINVELRSQITRRWKADAVVSDNRNQPLLKTTAPVSYVSIQGGLSRALTPRLSLELRYWRLQNTTTGGLPNPYFVQHNRVSTSLIYDFN
jgi:hypothetical protein